MQQNANGTDIAVIGGGPAGMAAALEAAARGFDVTIVSPPDRRPDQRTTALMMPAIAWLEARGVWQALQGLVAPLRTMRILDATDRLVRSPPATFRASEIDEAAFGYNMPNMALNAALAQAVDAETRIRRVIAKSEWVRIGDRSVTIGIEDAGPVEAQLAVAADGRKSSTRIAARIDTVEWSYPQTALVTCFSHQRPHGDASNEFHTVTGPFTTVPLPGNRCSLVWVETPHRARELAALDPAALSRIIEERMQSMLGKIEVDAPVQLWPLSGMVARRFALDRVLLVGEAAHAFPPIGAQGLNLGLRDVADFGACLPAPGGDPGAPASLAAYDRKRRGDVLMRTGAVHALNRSLLSPWLPAQLARGIGLSMLSAFPPLRGLFMREGMAPGSGFAATGRALRERVGR